MLWIHPHETTGVESTIIVVEFELILTVSTLIFFPPYPLEYGVDAVVRVTLANHRASEMHEQLPHLRVRVVKRLALLAHLFMPITRIARKGCHLQSHQSYSTLGLVVVVGAVVEWVLPVDL